MDVWRSANEEWFRRMFSIYPKEVADWLMDRIMEIHRMEVMMSPWRRK
jgi:hypothetical protein